MEKVWVALMYDNMSMVSYLRIRWVGGGADEFQKSASRGAGADNVQSSSLLGQSACLCEPSYKPNNGLT